MGVSSMQPVRVTTPGASPSLPLRMVAVGAGVTVPITFFVVAEGRYVPTNFPSFVLDPSKLVWDFNTESSNYATLRQQLFTAQPTAWQVESATPQSASQITNDIMSSAMYDPTGSGYADSMGNGAPAAAQADLDTLFNGINMSSLWITRLFGEMPRSALSKDFVLGASTDQTQVPTQLTPPKWVNCAVCTPGAGGATAATGSGAGNGTGAANGSSAGGAQFQGGPGSSASCAIGGEGSASLAFGGALGALALAFARRRRARLG
jgi:MYXO-CTERM domain-containing protein